MRNILFFLLFSFQLSLFSQSTGDYFLDADYVPIYYRLEMNLNPNQADFSGKTTMKFTTTATTNEIKVNAKHNLNIDNINYHDLSLNNYSREGKELTIILPESLPANRLDSISISFSGSADTSTGLTLGEHAGVPVIETLAEPWHASSWWVCKDDLINKVEKIDIYVTHPSEFKAASNGSLESVTNVGNGNSKTHWQHNHAIPVYLVGIAVTNYVEYNNSVDIGGVTVPIINYLYPEAVAEWSDALDAVPSYIEFLSEKFGDYPYKDEKYGHAQWNRNGGMEHSTMSFMGKFTFHLVTHELAHQWFGNKVTCSTWNDIWVNEGFADYCAGLLDEHIHGPESFDTWKETRIDLITAEDWGSVYVPEADSNNQNRVFNSRLTYKKGSMVVHLIRFILDDDELFYQILNNLLDDPEFSFGYASVEDFRILLETATNENWDKFYQDWIYGEGHPIFDIHLNKNTSSSNEYTLTFNQTPSHSSVDYFETPFEIEFIGTGNQVETRRFELTQAQQSFELNDLPFEVTSFTPNPGFDVICEINSSVLNTVELNPTEISIYPNPAKDYFIIDSPEKIEEIKVYDANGRLVYASSNKQLNIQIPTSDWAVGVYWVQINISQERRIEKLIVQQ